jgi:hypothetical protein
MAVTKLTNLGEITSNFLLNDFTVYIQNTSATGAYVGTDWEILGYTSPEKGFTPVNEKYVREDKIPRVPTYTKTIRIGAELTFGLSNQNPDIETILKQGTKTDLGATGTRIAYGTDQATQEYRAIRLVAQLDSKEYYAITVPKGELSQNGEKTLGGESEVITPIMLKAYYNPSANATVSLYYENYWASNVSPTADVPPGYN